MELCFIQSELEDVLYLFSIDESVSYNRADDAADRYIIIVLGRVLKVKAFALEL